MLNPRPLCAKAVEGYQQGEVAIPGGVDCAASAPAVDANFFSPGELDTLRAQGSVPMDNFRLHGGTGELPMAQAVPLGVGGGGGRGGALPLAAEVVMTTSAGVPIFKNPSPSPAATQYDGGSKGIKSSDPLLSSRDEIMRFLNTYNTRPRVACRIWGHHQERRHRNVTENDGDGNSRTRTETYYVTVTDFDYSVDMTQFIFPFGYVRRWCDAGGRVGGE